MRPTQMHSMVFHAGFTNNSANLSRGNNCCIARFSKLYCTAKMVEMAMRNKNIFNFKIIDILGAAIEIRIKNNSMSFMCHSETSMIDELKSSGHNLSTP